MRPAGKREAAGGGRAKSKRGERACFYRFVRFSPSRLVSHNRRYISSRLTLFIRSRLRRIHSRLVLRLVVASRPYISLSHCLFAIASVFDDVVSFLVLSLRLVCRLVFLFVSSARGPIRLPFCGRFLSRCVVARLTCSFLRFVLSLRRISVPLPHTIRPRPIAARPWRLILAVVCVSLPRSSPTGPI